MSKLRIFDFDPSHGRITIAGRTFHLPKSRPMRIAVGVLFVLGGFLWFLPILGLWMLPLGLLILSQDLPVVRRLRRKFVLRLKRRRRP